MVYPPGSDPHSPPPLTGYSGFWSVPNAPIALIPLLAPSQKSHTIRCSDWSFTGILEGRNKYITGWEPSLLRRDVPLCVWSLGYLERERGRVKGLRESKEEGEAGEEDQEILEEGGFIHWQNGPSFLLLTRLLSIVYWLSSRVCDGID